MSSEGHPLSGLARAQKHVGCAPKSRWTAKNISITHKGWSITPLSGSLPHSTYLVDRNHIRRRLRGFQDTASHGEDSELH